MTKPVELTIVDEAMLLLTFSDCKIFVNTEDNHYKYWTYRIDRLTGDTTFYWGRIGKSTQSLSKSFGSERRAISEVNDKIREKTNKGYKVIQ